MLQRKQVPILQEGSHAATISIHGIRIHHYADGV